MKKILLLLCCLPFLAYGQQSASDKNLQSRKEEVHHEMDSLLHDYLDENPSDGRKVRIVVPKPLLESMTALRDKFGSPAQYTTEDIAKAEYTVGCFHESNFSKKSAVKWFMKAVELGQQDAMFQIGQSYEKGSLGQRKDTTQAINWHTKAAELGSYEAMFSLGSIYYNGGKVKAPHSKILDYFKSAAKGGNAKATAKLGNVYDEGIITKRNVRKAIECWQIAAEKGEHECYAFIGKKYLEGDGVKQDEKKALDYFKQGSNLENAESSLQLALCYYNGQGAEIDYFRAYSLLSDASFYSGFGVRYFYLAECLRLGRGVEIDYKKAALYYILAIRENKKYTAPREELKKLFDEGKVKPSDIERF